MSVRHMLTILAAAGVVISGAVTAAAAPKAAPKPAANSAEPTLVGQFGAWGVYVALPNGRKICFALSKPTSSKTNPPNRPRDEAHAFISSRPAEKVSNEVSVIIGYPLKPDGASAIEVGGARYDMYAEGDGLWIKNAAEEARLVEALRAGADAVVKGISTRGTETTDVFSLKGVTQALDRMAQECRG